METRPENPTNENKSSLRGLIWVLAVVVAVLAAALICLSVNRNRIVNDLNDEKDALEEQIKDLQKDYAELSSDYDTINLQLDSSRAELSALVERVQKTDATNRAKIRQYQKELGTLRSIMRSYIVQIDSLNTLNHKLTADAAAARKEAATTRQQNEELQKTVTDLSDKVAAGSVVRARNFKAFAYNKNGKQVERAHAAVDIMVSLSLGANDIARKGPMRIYMVVTDPDGNLVTNGESRQCNCAGEEIATSASREIDYQGGETDLSIYLKGIQGLSKGVYTIKVVSAQAVLGSAQLMLR